jgi:isocitrate dehydrogenase
VDMGGYYQPDPVRTGRAMRPSPTLNAIIDGLAGGAAS